MRKSKQLRQRTRPKSFVFFLHPSPLKKLVFLVLTGNMKFCKLYLTAISFSELDKMPPGLSGPGQYGRFIMKLTQRGCSNRPFFHVVVIKSTFPNSRHIPPLEQVGTYDPLPNDHNEKLVALNLERIQHYLAHGVHLSQPVAQLLGLSGLTPQHPETYVQAWRNREALRSPEMRRANVLLPEEKEESNRS